MHNQNELAQNENFFETIYRLAKKKDKAALWSLVNAGISIDFFFGEYNPIKLLAKEGDHDTVQFLMNEFRSSRTNALEGYAQGGYVHQVDQLLKEGEQRIYAIRGYAKSGNFEQVKKLLGENADLVDITFAATGYARGGHVKQVEELINAGVNRNHIVENYALGGHIEQVNEQIKHGAKRDDAVFGYAWGGYVEQVNEQIKQGANRKIANVGYILGGFTQQSELLRLLASTDDLQLQDLLIEEAKNKIKSLDAALLREKANRLHRIMEEYKCSFDQAKALSIKGASAWLLQGPVLVSEDVIAKDIFFEISSFLMSLSTQDVKKMLAAVNEKLFIHSKADSLNKYKMCFFSREEYLDACKQAEERHDIRMQILN